MTADVNTASKRIVPDHKIAVEAYDISLESTLKSDDLLLLVTTEMPYGKYKGRRIADLPGNYLTWFSRQGFPKGEIGRLLALMHEIDHNGLGDLLKPLRVNTTGRA